MFKTTILILISLHVLYSSRHSNTTCTIESEDGYQFDLLSLNKKDEFYQIQEDFSDSTFFALAYVFNFCGNHPRICQNIPAAYEVINVLGQLTDSCEIIGRVDFSSATLLDKTNPEKGVVIKYTKGVKCEQSDIDSEIGEDRTVSFYINCNQRQDKEFIKMKNSSKCNLKFQINSPSGCVLPKQHKLISDIDLSIVYQNQYLLAAAVIGASILFGIIYRVVVDSRSFSQNSLNGFEPLRQEDKQEQDKHQEQDPELGQQNIKEKIQ